MPEATETLRCAALLCAMASLTWGQATPIDQAPVPDRSYKMLRENENWSFLRDKSLRDDPWDAWKYIEIRSHRNHWFMTLGGESREEWQQTANDNWGQKPIMNGYFLQRYMFHVDTHYGESVRTFVQLKSNSVFFQAGSPRATDQKKLDFLAAFVELRLPGKDKSPTVRLGRQELSFGSGRLVGLREGPNTRLSFDGFRLKSNLRGWVIDGVGVRPTLDRAGFFDNRPDSKASFWGVYSTRSLPKVSLDLYYLGINRKRATFQRGSRQEIRHSLGVRLWRTPPKQKPGFDFDYEAVWQFGTFGRAGIRAWTIASDTGFSFSGTALKPRVSVKADVSSGDDPRRHTMGTFNALYPIGNYFGVIASAGPGPVNFMDVNPRVDFHPARSLSISADWVVQWRQSVRDGLYSFSGALIRASGDSNARFVGHRPGAELRWQVDRHVWFKADYGIFFAGSFLRQTKPGRNLNYLALMAGYTF